MTKKLLIWSILLALLPATLSAQTTTADIRAKVARIGTGNKAKVKVKLNNGTQVKGYIAEAQDADFVVRDSKTDAATTIAYADVKKVEKNKGSNVKLYAIIAGVAVAAVVVLVVTNGAYCDGGAGDGILCR